MRMEFDERDFETVNKMFEMLNETRKEELEIKRVKYYLEDYMYGEDVDCWTTKDTNVLSDVFLSAKFYDPNNQSIRELESKLENAHLIAVVRV